MIALPKRQLQRDILLTCSMAGLSLFSLGVLVSQSSLQVGSPQFLTSVSTLAVGLLLVVGAGRLQRLLGTYAALETRLCQFAQSTSDHELTPMLERGPVAAGWNHVVDMLNTRRLDQAIERRITQSAGQPGSERYARALRSLSEGLAISDRHGRLSYANPAWQQLLNPQPDSEEKSSGQSLSQQMATAGFINWEEHEAHLLEGTKPWSCELRRSESLADGALQITRLPLEGRVQENEGYVWTLRDITQSSLANHAHEQFLSAATHELRTPLTNIKAYSESLIDMEHIAPAQQREFFNVIHAEAERLSRLLNELLDIQQLEAGSMTVSPSTFDVQRMLQELQEHMDPLLEQKQLKFICRIAPDIKTIQADKEKIISCLINLLGNAIKYTPPQGEIRLLAEQLDSSVSIAVEDNGIGIAEEEQAKVFERFYRCSDERVCAIEGNGLGLAFAMEVARLHHGDLKVESKLNVGSRFTLRLPLTNAS
jgi:signal transduction histidine kinase